MRYIVKAGNKLVAANAKAALYEWFKDGKDFSVEFKRYVKNRSTEQNRYLWGVVYDVIASELGYSKEDVHLEMARRFLAEKEIEVFGQSKIIAKSTSKLTTVEFTQYVEQIRAFVAELGITIPEPEVSYDND